jgi:hypothetical protein
MNYVDAEVIEVLGLPFFINKHWFVKVKADSEGGNFETTIIANSKEEAENIKAGHIFLS